VVNPLLSGMWGRTPANVLQRPIFEAVPELQGQGAVVEEVRLDLVPLLHAT
jgi:hypothetical protein